MNWLDIVIVLIVAVGTFIGMKEGIIKAVLITAGLIVGTVLAGRYYLLLSEQLTFISQPSLAKIAAFAIIFVGMLIIAAVVATVVKWVVSAVMLGWLNHLLGAGIGFVMGTIFCAALLTIWVKFLGGSSPIYNSSLARVLLESFPVALSLLPSEFDSVRSFFM
jgi:membrane protein required for colicin V production